MSETTTLPGASALHAGPATPAPARAGWLARRWLILVPLVLSLSATVLAMRRTSTTFDEIVLIAGGARGFHVGRFDLAPDHPPLMQYLYGLPAYASGARYPSEAHKWGPVLRYVYARDFFWAVGNDPQRLAFRSRLVAVLLAGLLVLTTWGYTRRWYGPATALVAGTLVAFLPDVLAHGGVAYNDVPMALAFLASLWAIDAAVRRPGIARGALAGGLVACAVGVKYSAVLIAPAALLLIGAEAILRPRDRAWRGRLLLAVLAAVATLYVGLVVLFRGDFFLQGLRLGIAQQLLHVRAAGGVPAFFLGQAGTEGWWYFFPVAFLLKTPAALHVLLVLALAAFGRAALQARLAHMRSGTTSEAGAASAGGVDLPPGPGWRPLLRRALASPLRLPLVGALVFGYALLTSRLDIGFRYALPVLPLLCIVTAAGLARAWSAATRPALRWALGALLAWYVAAPLTAYPWFLSYVSEYGPGRDSAYEVLSDSNLDWGQGLLDLRAFMRAEHIPVVYLSYFGSAPPAGYGIRYVALASFFPLWPTQRPQTPPKWVVVSATHLDGVYLNGDPYARFRGVRPDRVLGGSLYAFRIRD